MYHDLFTQLTAHDRVLTVNQRLAAFLQQEYPHHQHAILPFSTWLARCWEENPTSYLLNTMQEQTLWEQIIRHSPSGENLLQITTTAQMAQQAWQLAKQWQINLRSPLFAYSEDTAAWQQWAQQWQNLCRSNNWIDINSIPDQLIKEKRFSQQGKIFLVGFAELTPQQQALLANFSCQLVPSPSITSTVSKIACADTKTELHTAARWAYTLWQQNPHQRIGIVIPNLTAIRSQVVDVFTDIFAPESKLPGYQTKPLAFNISAGLPLSEYFLIHNALSLLPNEEITALPSQWAEIFSQHLKNVGWPGERTLDSTEYQLTQRWSALLTEFASLDAVQNKINAKNASKQLSKLAANIIFQPESPAVPIQILGALEAASLNFQHVWFMGLHDQAWPPPLTFNPFIPRKLQHESEFYPIITQQLLQSAEKIIVSHPQYEEDQKLQPSAFIRDIPAIEQQDLNLAEYTSYALRIFASAQTEFFEDTYAPPIQSTEKITGGTAIFKQQAACPFQAFAHFRLGAKSAINPQVGLSARDRGSLLHHALETLWNKLGSHEQLTSCNPEQLQAIIEQTVTATLAVFTLQQPDIFKKQFTHLEKLRLTQLLTQWLALEKQREPFTVIGTEHTQTYTINHIPLQLKVDRIDRLADGAHLIIDYKTGSATTTTNAWFGERPDEPQLLLYFLAYPLPVTGLAFAQLSSNKLQFKGINANDVTNWDQQKEQWRHTLEKLADQFVQGYAKVDPKYGEKTCRICDLQLLCRIKN